MNRLIKIFIVVFFVFGYSALSNVSIAAEPFKVGGLFALSGGWAFIGIDMKNTAQFVFDKVNAAGGINGRKIKFIQADTEGDPTKALLATKRLVEQEKVCVIVGPVKTGVGMALKPYIDSAKVPTVMHCGSDVVIDRPPTHWVFKPVFRASSAVRVMFAYMKRQGIKKLGLMHVQGGFGQDGLKNAQKLAPEYGIKIVGIESFGGKDVDMKPQLLNLRAKNPQAILCWTVGPTAAIAARNVKELSYKVPFFQSHGSASLRFIKIAGPAAEGNMTVSGKLHVVDELRDSDPLKPLIKEFVQGFTKAYKAPDIMGGIGVDIANIVVEALRKAGDNRSAIRDAIENTRGLVGVTAIYNLSPTDHCGVDTKDLVLLKVQDGKFRLVKD